MRIAMIGTRGVPARYGGFETAVEEVGQRLAARGHDVTVYCRSDRAKRPEEVSRPAEYAGMHLVYLPALRKRSLETLSHTALSVLHLVRKRPVDAALVFNAANSPFLPLLRLRRVRAATHVDGLEWRRGKWGPTGQRYYRLAESLSVRWSDQLIADARGIADYYREEFGAATREIAYGATILDEVPSGRLAPMDLLPGGYHLIVARFEPENHVDMAIEGYLQSQSRLPLVVVGSSPYPGAHVARIQELAATDPRVRLVGGVWDEELLNQLYAHALTYIHGHSVGGTNPSLLRAMGAATATLAYDVGFNREVLGTSGRFFDCSVELARQIDEAERDTEATALLGKHLQARAAAVYTWEGVTDRYEALCESLMRGESQRGRYTGRRSPTTRWRSDATTPANAEAFMESGRVQA